MTLYLGSCDLNHSVVPGWQTIRWEYCYLMPALAHLATYQGNMQMSSTCSSMSTQLALLLQCMRSSMASSTPYYKMAQCPQKVIFKTMPKACCKT